MKNNSTLTPGLRIVRLVTLLFYLSGVAPAHGNVTEANGDTPATMNKMKITIGSRTFTATLHENPTVAALKAMLPLTVAMTELNGNEKYFHFSTDLPVNATKPDAIHAGDLMLWQSNSLVLFYKSFRSSYSYTKLGRLDDVSGLAAAVGSGNIKVTFELGRSGK